MSMPVTCYQDAKESNMNQLSIFNDRLELTFNESECTLRPIRGTSLWMFDKLFTEGMWDGEGSTLPKTNVIYSAVNHFLVRMSGRLPGVHLRLPNTSEWISAACMGSYNVPDIIKYSDEPNEWGFYNMYGEIWQMCSNRLGIGRAIMGKTRDTQYIYCCGEKDIGFRPVLEFVEKKKQSNGDPR